MGAEGFDQTSLERPQLSIQHSKWHQHQEQADCQHSEPSHGPGHCIKCTDQIGCRRKLLG